jgi:hypothetical protein
VKNFIFWDITSCSPLKVNRCFGGTCCLHLQDRRINQARNLLEVRWQSEQSACRNFGFHRKQDGSERQQVSSHWLARKTQWIAITHWLFQHNRANQYEARRGVVHSVASELGSTGGSFCPVGVQQCVSVCHVRGIQVHM